MPKTQNNNIVTINSAALLYLQMKRFKFVSERSRAYWPYAVFHLYMEPPFRIRNGSCEPMQEKADDEFERLLQTGFETTSSRQQVDDNTVVMRNICSATKADIEGFFKPCGPLLSVLIRRGCAFVEFKSPEMKRLALKLDGGVLRGRRVGVSPKMPDRRRGPGKRWPMAD